MAGRGQWRGCSEVNTPERHLQSRLTSIKGRTGSGLRVVVGVVGDVLGYELKGCSCVCKEQQPEIKDEMMMR